MAFIEGGDPKVAAEKVKKWAAILAGRGRF